MKRNAEDLESKPNMRRGQGEGRKCWDPVMAPRENESHHSGLEDSKNHLH